MAKTREQMLEEIDGAVKTADDAWETAKAANPENPYGTDESGIAYGLSADAMWKAGEAAFNYAASHVGASGFQGSWAALTLYGKLVNITGPFIVLKGEDMLYPQYNLTERLHDWASSDDMARWLGERAAELLEKGDGVDSVKEHWSALVAAADALPPREEA